jgi:hypothetical protein
VPVPARIGGRADLDLTVVVPGSQEGSSAIARGTAALSRVDVRDGGAR